MSISGKSISPDRKFLHDLATPMTVLKHIIKKFRLTLEKEEPFDREDALQRLAKALKALEQMEALHAERKADVHQREKA